MRKYDETERQSFFGPNWANQIYSSWIRNVGDDNDEFSVILVCSQRSNVYDPTLICLLFGVSVQDYKNKAIEYGGDIIKDDRVYFTNKERCEQFRKQYVEGELIESFKVMQRLVGHN